MRRTRGRRCGSSSARTRPTPRLPTRSTRSLATATLSPRSTCASARRWRPSIAPASTPTSTPVDRTLTYTFGETRSCLFNHAVSRAAALADHSADPELAALIALAAVVRDPHFIQQANLVDLADSGSIIAGPWGGTTAIPPELRRFLATWKRKLSRERPHPAVPLFPGNSHGRRGRPAIRRTLQALDAPASLWEDPPDTEIGTGDSADGRALLRHLTAWNLWLQRRHETTHPASTGH